MTLGKHLALSATLALVCACGGKTGDMAKSGGDTAKASTDDPNAVFGPLDIGSDWQSYTKVNTQPVESGDHGERFVDTYVNDIGLAAYKDGEAEIPVGTVVVKTSWERDGDKPSTTPGPIFVMEKRAAGFNEANQDWYYAIHWENPVGRLKEKFGQMYWRSPSKRVGYCSGCHNDYDRQLGQVPEEFRVP